MKRIAILGSLLFFIGCSVTAPAVTEYRVDPLLNNETDKLQLCRDKTITIGQVFTENSLITNQMKYVQSGYKEFSYTQSEWASSPNKAISRALLKSVRDSKVFASVSSYRSRARNELLLETNVDSFIQYYGEENNSSFVKVVFSLSLVDVKDVKAIDSIVIEKKIQSESLNAEGGVKALNTGLSEVLEETNIWLSEACR